MKIPSMAISDDVLLAIKIDNKSVSPINISIAYGHHQNIMICFFVAKSFAED